MSLFVIFLLSVLIAFVCYYVAHSLPPSACSSVSRLQFSEQRVLKNLREITRETREAGSFFNEIAMPHILLDKIQQAKMRAADPGIDISLLLNITTIVQSGSGWRTYTRGSSSGILAFSNVTNIVTIVQPAAMTNGDTAPLVLVSSHYDSALDSPGASDDGLAVCLMLESFENLLHQLKRGDWTPPKGVAFLWNSHEEYGLLGAHGFVNSVLAPRIDTFVNLEAAGAAVGRAMLFQVGPRDHRLAQVYANAVPYPHASVVGQDVFGTGLLPSDTDFRVYKEAIRGLDVAFYKRGEVYHTPLDTVDYIELGAVQAAGENLNALLVALSVADFTGTAAEDPVYFDVLAQFVVVLTRRQFNSLALVALFVRSNWHFNWLATVYEALLVVFCTIVAAGIGYGMSVVAPMTYFSNLYIVWPLFAAIPLSVYSVLAPSVKHRGTWSCLLITSVFFSIGSGYLAFAAVVAEILSLSYAPAFLFAKSLSIVLLFDVANNLLQLLSGMTGRLPIGDVLIAPLAALFVVLAATQWIDAVTPRQRKLLAMAMLATGLASGVFAVTSLRDSVYTRHYPKRVLLQHLRDVNNAPLAERGVMLIASTDSVPIERIVSPLLVQRSLNSDVHDLAPERVASTPSHVGAPLALPFGDHNATMRLAQIDVQRLDARVLVHVRMNDAMTVVLTVPCDGVSAWRISKQQRAFEAPLCLNALLRITLTSSVFDASSSDRFEIELRSSFASTVPVYVTSVFRVNRQDEHDPLVQLLQSMPDYATVVMSRVIKQQY